MPVSAHARRTTLTLLGGLGAFETGPDGAWEFVTPAFLELLGGLPASSLLGREWINRIHPDDVNRTLAEYRQAREFRRPWSQRVRMMAADSVPVWLSFNAYPLPGGTDSRGVVLIGVVKDITAEMRTQQRAQEATQTISDMADFYSQGLVILRDDHIIEANVAAGRIHQCQPEELIGRTASSLIWPGDEPKFERPVKGEAELFMTGRIRRVGDGKSVLIASHGRPIMYAGAPARIVSFVPVDDPHIQAVLEDRNLRRLQSLESLLPVAYHRVSLEGEDVGVIEYANERFAALLGRTAAELIGHSVLEFTHPEHIEHSRVAMEAFAGTEGRKGSVLRRFVHASGVDVFLVLDISIYLDSVTGHAVSMALSRPVDPEDPGIRGMRIR